MFQHIRGRLTLCILFLLCLIAPSAAATQTPATIRVGYPIQSRLTEIDENGHFSGYTYEYLQEIAQFTGWNYEFVQIEGADINESLTQLMHMLETGEIDLMGSLLYSQDSGQRYTYTGQSYGTVDTILQVPISEAGKTSFNVRAGETIRIAVTNLTGRTTGELKSFCEMNGIIPELVLCESDVEQIQAVQEGRADFFLNTSLNYIEDVYTVTKFSSKPFYFATKRTGNEDLIAQLDQAILSINQSDPYFTAQLLDKYFFPNATSFALSEEEKAYVSDSDILKIGVLCNQPPYYFLSEDGQEQGITVDILDLIAQDTGLRFEIVPIHTVQELYGGIDTGQLDLVADMTYDYDFAHTHNVSMTRPYLTAPPVFILRKDARDNAEMRIALPLFAYTGAVLPTDIQLDSMGACVEAVNEGQADYTSVDSYVAQYYANVPQFWGLKQIPNTDTARRICFGVVKPTSPELLSILNKTILKMPQTNLQSIIMENTLPEQKLTFDYYVREYPAQVILALCGILLLVLLIFYQHFRADKLSAMELKKRLRIYALTHASFFEYNFKNNRIEIYSTKDKDISSRTEHYDCNTLFEEHNNHPFLNTIRNGHSGTFELHLRCVDGQLHWLRITMETIYDTDAHPTYAIGKVKMIDNEKAEKAALIEKAQIDGLTGIFNALTSKNAIKELLSHAKQSHAGALIVLDIDHFKTINDTYGHMVGDKALQDVAQILRDIFQGPQDIVGRIGGDEFIIYFSLEDADDPETLLREKCATLCETAQVHSKANNIPFTLSVGVARCAAGNTYEERFQKADHALYHAKRQGRNRFEIAEQVDVVALTSNPTAPHSKWLAVEQYQTVLRTIHMVAFEYDYTTQTQRVSPFIHECIAGSYDNRLICDVFLEEQIVYSEDTEKGIQLQAQFKSDRPTEITLRLLTPCGEYRWFKITMCNYMDATHDLRVGVIADVDQEVQQQQRLRYHAHYDPISGLRNKMTYFEDAAELLSCHADSPHFLLRMDIDRFKLVNELYSITEGDLVLRHIGTVLQKLLGKDEICARLESDIFSACVSRTEAEVIRLIHTLEQQVNTYQIDFHFILSVGIVRIPHYEGEPINTLCDRAALAQRTIKGNYIRRYAFYDKCMSDSLNQEHYIIARMGLALKEKQFVVYMQPKWDMRNHAVIGAESLVRWQHPQDGLIPPGEFIPLFERNGFIQRLDEYVWDTTCRTLRDWINRGISPVPVSINVSRVHVYDPKFCDKIKALVAKYDLPPELLELEITESAYTECPQTLYNIMDDLQSSGFSFSMDDFGSGYSSLSVLKDIPVDLVKIDLNFLQTARRGEAVGRNILRGTIHLVQSMNLPVIVEGVETLEQVDFLLQAGCTMAQGYFYARPMPIPDFEQVLLKNYAELQKDAHPDS